MTALVDRPVQNTDKRVGSIRMVETDYQKSYYGDLYTTI